MSYEAYVFVCVCVCTELWWHCSNCCIIAAGELFNSDCFLWASSSWSTRQHSTHTHIHTNNNDTHIRWCTTTYTHSTYQHIQTHTHILTNAVFRSIEASLQSAVCVHLHTYPTEDCQCIGVYRDRQSVSWFKAWTCWNHVFERHTDHKNEVHECNIIFIIIKGPVCRIIVTPSSEAPDCNQMNTLPRLFMEKKLT